MGNSGFWRDDLVCDPGGGACKPLPEPEPLPEPPFDEEPLVPRPGPRLQRAIHAPTGNDADKTFRTPVSLS